MTFSPINNAPAGDDLVRATLPYLLELSKPSQNLGLLLSALRPAPAGSLISRFKGRGMEFDEVRLYQAGDDVRNIDWRVTARSGEPHTKLFREERERPVFISVDYRAAMFFATRGVFKSVKAAQLAALLAWSAHHHGDRVGGQVFSENHAHDFKPRNGRAAVLRFLRSLCDPGYAELRVPRDGGETLARSAVHLLRLARPGSLVFVISDFRKLDAVAENHLIRLARHCEVVLVEVFDPIEAEFPWRGRFRISDGVRELLLDATDAKRMTEYHERFLRHREHLRQLAFKSKMKFIVCSTADDPVKVLQQDIRPGGKSL